MSLSTRMRVIEKIIMLKENLFSKLYLVPLFYAMGYEEVEFYGGNYEKGKDLICWKHGETGLLELTLVQVKRYKPSATSSDKRSFSQVINQLSELLDSKVPYKDGQEYYPDRVYFITPYAIDARALETRFDSYSKLFRSHGVKVIDGGMLFNLFEKHCYSALIELAGKDVAIQNITTSVLSNKELLLAIESRIDKNIEDYYINLDFGVGRINTRFFFSHIIQPSAIEFRLSEGEWQQIKNINSISLDNYGASIICGEINSISEKYYKDLSDYNIKVQKINAVRSSIDDIYNHLNMILGAIYSRSKSRAERKDDPRNNIFRLAKKSQDKIYDIIDLYTDIYAILEEDKSAVEKGAASIGISLTLKSKLSELERLEELLIGHSDFSKKIPGYYDYIFKLVIEKNKILSLEIGLLEPKFIVTLDGEKLAIVFNEKKNWLDTQVSHFNTSDDYRGLESFLKELHSMFKSFDVILSNQNICRVLGVNVDQKFALSDKPKFNFDIDNIFNVDMDFSILGEAGAGKTTTLLMFAKNQITKNKIDSALYFYIPLSLLYTASKNDSRFSEEINCDKKLLIGISNYLKTLNLNQEFRRIAPTFLDKSCNTTKLCGGLL